MELLAGLPLAGIRLLLQAVPAIVRPIHDLGALTPSPSPWRAP